MVVNRLTGTTYFYRDPSVVPTRELGHLFFCKNPETSNSCSSVTATCRSVSDPPRRLPCTYVCTSIVMPFV